MAGASDQRRLRVGEDATNVDGEHKLTQDTLENIGVAQSRRSETAEQKWVNDRIEARERKNRGETRSCEKCGGNGVVGEDLRAGCEVGSPSGSFKDYWVHNSCLTIG